MARTETLTKLCKFTTPTICNIIKLFEIRPSNAGFMDACIISFFPEMPPMVDYATTATFRS
ncbi:MAG: hypothetical protein Q8L41_01485 [Anaerolineales bacterium]|nr:hypothetical protein [Anaerolineales bacterium]